MVETDSDDLVGYARLGDDVVLVVVTLTRTPPTRVSASCRPPSGCCRSSTPSAARNYVRLGPGQAHVMEVQRP